MRKRIAALLLMVMILLPVSTLAKELDSKLFANAKEAVSLISYGEYKKALKKLGLGASKDDVTKLIDFADKNLSSAYYGDVQNEVAVGYAASKGFKLAVPVTTPDSWDVEALVILTKDGKSPSGYTAMLWGDVLTELEESGSVTWNKAYEPGTPLIVADQ